MGSERASLSVAFVPATRCVHLVRAAALAIAVLGGARAGRAQSTGSPPDSAGLRPGIERLSAVVQQRLQLTDDQTARLRETSQRYADQRQALLRDERDARRTVRDEVSRGGAADQTRVQGALDRLYAIQQRRSELAASEQRELAGFLTPTQRAQYAGLQERAFRAAQAIRQQRAAAGGGPAVGGQPLPVDVNRAAQALQAQRRAERQQQQQLMKEQRQAEREARRAARQGHPPGR